MDGLQWRLGSVAPRPLIPSNNFLQLRYQITASNHKEIFSQYNLLLFDVKLLIQALLEAQLHCTNCWLVVNKNTIKYTTPCLPFADGPIIY